MSTPLTADQSEMAAVYLGFAIKVARPWQGRRPDLNDEIASAAHQGLMSGVATYNPTGRAKITSWIARHVNFSILNLVRTSASRIVTEPFPPDLAYLATPARDDTRFDRMLGLLPESWVPAMRLIYSDGLTHREAAEALGLTWRRVAWINETALAFLREQLESLGGHAGRHDTVSPC